MLFGLLGTLAGPCCLLIHFVAIEIGPCELFGSFSQHVPLEVIRLFPVFACFRPDRHVLLDGTPSLLVVCCELGALQVDDALRAFRERRVEQPQEEWLKEMQRIGGYPVPRNAERKYTVLKNLES